MVALLTSAPASMSILTTASCPLRTAERSAVYPSSSCLSTSAPASSSKAMQTLRPEKAAATSGKVQRRLERLSLLVRFTSAPASIRAFTTSSRPLVTANSRGLVNAPLLTSKPDSRRALTAGKLPDSAAQNIGAVSHFISSSSSSVSLSERRGTGCILSSATIFASIDRTPPTLHTAWLNDLLTCAKLSVPHKPSLGSISASNKSGSSSARATTTEISPRRTLSTTGLVFLRVSMAALEVAAAPKPERKPRLLLGAAERNFENNLQLRLLL